VSASSLLPRTETSGTASAENRDGWMLARCEHKRRASRLAARPLFGRYRLDDDCRSLGVVHAGARELQRGFDQRTDVIATRSSADSSATLRTTLPVPRRILFGSGSSSPRCRKHKLTPRRCAASETIASDGRELARSRSRRSCSCHRPARQQTAAWPAPWLVNPGCARASPARTCRRSHQAAARPSHRKRYPSKRRGDATRKRQL
jgi:hypothetical protein